METWKLWLETISVLGGTASPVIINAMAEALSLAAPQGPQGFDCSDNDCTEVEEECSKITPKKKIRRLEQALKGLLKAQNPNEWMTSDRSHAIQFARAVLEGH
jgi:hypothetical protein